jgi:hypothetical protein
MDLKLLEDHKIVNCVKERRQQKIVPYRATGLKMKQK